MTTLTLKLQRPMHDATGPILVYAEGHIHQRLIAPHDLPEPVRHALRRAIKVYWLARLDGASNTFTFISQTSEPGW